MKDWQSTLETLLHKALLSGATKADAVWFDNVDLSLACRKGTLEGLDRSESRAITLRAFCGDSQAIVSSTDTSLKSLENLARAAVDMARISPPDPLCRLAPKDRILTSMPALDLCDEDEPETESLFSRAQEVEAAALAIKGITNSEGAEASYSKSLIGLMTADDGKIQFSGHYKASHSSLSTSVLAGSGTEMQRDYDFSTARHQSDLKKASDIGRLAGERTVARMHPKKIPSGAMPVIYDRRVSRQLVSAFASCINGSSIVRGASFLLKDMDKPIFSSNVTMVDNPLRKRGLASKPFDGEGVATQMLTLVDKGILTSWVLDVRSAAALNLATTGHASRSMGSPPSPSTTNLYMEAGKDSLEALMKPIKKGLLITETFGTGINTITGDYSQGASGFMIENGVIAYPVAEITIAGHLRDMFAQMIPANDLVFDYATNAPSIFIERMSVAGA